MNPQDETDFKDEDIAKVAADLTKQNRKQFGETFKTAANRLGTDSQPAPVFGNPISTRLDKLAPPPTVISSLSDESQLTPEKKELYSIVKPLRTYERDVAETIRNKNESVTSVKIAAEVKKVEQIKKGEVTVERVERASKKGLIFVISLVLILSGLGIGGLVFNFFANRPAPVVQEPLAIITTNTKQTLDITNKNPEEIIRLIQNLLEQTGTENNLSRIDLAENISGDTKNISPQRFFELFAESAPSALGRALGTELVFGFQTVGKNEPFIFTNISSFDNAYDGMIRFEQNIAKDFGPIFIKSGTILTNSTSTTARFEDLVIRSKDTRVLKDAFGNVILIYSFLDTKTLVITTNETTFRELLTRFFSSQIVR